MTFLILKSPHQVLCRQYYSHVIRESLVFFVRCLGMKYTPIRLCFKNTDNKLFKNIKLFTDSMLLMCDIKKMYIKELKMHIRIKSEEGNGGPRK